IDRRPAALHESGPAEPGLLPSADGRGVRRGRIESIDPQSGIQERPMNRHSFRWSGARRILLAVSLIAGLGSAAAQEAPQAPPAAPSPAEAQQPPADPAAHASAPP